MAPPPRIGETAPPPAEAPAEAEPTPPAPPPKFEHKGFTAELQVGLQGCVRRICREDRHDARPGFRFDAFLGGNIRGFVELGFAGGWGTLGANVEPGTHALALYGVDVTQLEQALGLLGQVFAFDLDQLLVRDARMRIARGGPHLRIHVLPRGRFAAFVGAGVGYSLFRARYTLNTGEPLRLDFHGIDVPIEAGGAYFVHRNIAVGLQFRYHWARYFAAFIDHPLQRAAAPISMLDDAMFTDTSSLRRDLPHSWSLNATVRFRF